MSAVRGVRRAGETARHAATGEQRERLDAALGEFDHALPDAKDARDVLEHFDPYAAGAGHLQRAERDDGSEVTMYPVLVYNDSGCVVVTVGPLRVDVAVAAAAAAKLARTVGVTDAGDSIKSGLRCTHVRYLGGPAAESLHVVDRSRRLAVGDVVTFPGVWEEQPDYNAGGSYVVVGHEWHAGVTYAIAAWVPQ